MPQMMPLNWLSMLLSINLILMLFSIIMFNSFIPIKTTSIKISTKTNFNKWSW